jgi:hypothetical protein
MDRQHQVCSSAAHACASMPYIDAIALAHLSQRAHCLASQEMTASRAPMSFLTVPTELLAFESSWRSPHVALAVSFSVHVREACLCADLKHVSWASVGPRPRCVAQSLRAWSRL